MTLNPESILLLFFFYLICKFTTVSSVIIEQNNGTTYLCCSLITFIYKALICSDIWHTYSSYNSWICILSRTYHGNTCTSFTKLTRANSGPGDEIFSQNILCLVYVQIKQYRIHMFLNNRKSFKILRNTIILHSMS